MIKVYYSNVSFFQMENKFDTYLKQIEEERRNKILRTRNPELRVRSLATGILLHRAVCEMLGREPENTPAFQMGYEQAGKPFLTEYPSIHFNLSHSGDYICCAVCDRPVGIDIQKHTAVKQNVAERFFTKIDNQLLAACSIQERQILFYRMWCRKESYGKLTGKGLGQSMNQFEIDWERDAVLNCENMRMPPLAYYKEWSELTGYSMCVCSDEPEQEILWERVENLFFEHGISDSVQKK